MVTDFQLEQALAAPALGKGRLEAWKDVESAVHPVASFAMLQYVTPGIPFNERWWSVKDLF